MTSDELHDAFDASLTAATHQHRGEQNPARAGDEGAAEGPVFVGVHRHEVEGALVTHEHDENGWPVT